MNPVLLMLLFSEVQTEESSQPKDDAPSVPGNRGRTFPNVNTAMKVAIKSSDYNCNIFDETSYTIGTPRDPAYSGPFLPLPLPTACT